MYLFCVLQGNYIPMGSDGEMKIPSTVRSKAGIEKLARGLLAGRAGHVYQMKEWSQKMCEMSPLQFTTHIIQCGEKVV